MVSLPLALSRKFSVSHVTVLFNLCTIMLHILHMYIRTYIPNMLLAVVFVYVRADTIMFSRCWEGNVCELMRLFISRKDWEKFQLKVSKQLLARYFYSCESHD